MAIYVVCDQSGMERGGAGVAVRPRDLHGDPVPLPVANGNPVLW